MPRKVSNEQAVAVIKLARDLGFVQSELSGGVMIHVPTWKQFEQSLPRAGARHKVVAFRTITAFLESRVSVPDIRRRWKIWHTGTVRVDNQLGKF